jgi:hypothetical protein
MHWGSYRMRIGVGRALVGVLIAAVAAWALSPEFRARTTGAEWTASISLNELILTYELSGGWVNTNGWLVVKHRDQPWSGVRKELGPWVDVWGLEAVVYQRNDGWFIFAGPYPGAIFINPETLELQTVCYFPPLDTEQAQPLTGLTQKIYAGAHTSFFYSGMSYVGRFERDLKFNVHGEKRFTRECG